MAATTAFAIAGTLAACGSGEGGEGGTTISYYSWHNAAGMQPIVDAFEEANPDITVDLSTASGDANDYAETLMTRIAGNQTPDVFHMSIETRSEVIESGAARDLTGEPFMEGIDPTATELYTADGSVYGMSTSAWAGVIVYNADLLAQAGYDEVPATLDEFIEMGEALNELGVIAYMDDPTVVSGSFSPMLGGHYAASGQSDTEVFAGETTFAEQWTPVIEQWQELVESGVMPASVVGVSGDQIKQQFMTGELAMYRSGAWDFPDLDTSGINYSTAPFPAIDGGEPYVGGGPDSPYVISSSSEGEKLQAAQKFLTFLNSPEGLELAEANIGQVSTSANYDSKVPAQIEDVYQDYIKTGKYYWINWPEHGTVMGQEIAAQFQLLIQGQQTPEQTAASLDAKWASR